MRKKGFKTYIYKDTIKFVYCTYIRTTIKEGTFYCCYDPPHNSYCDVLFLYVSMKQKNKASRHFSVVSEYAEGFIQALIEYIEEMSKIELYLSPYDDGKFIDFESMAYNSI